MQKFSHEKLEELKKRAKTAARFEGNDEAVKAINRSIVEYEAAFLAMNSHKSESTTQLSKFIAQYHEKCNQLENNSRVVEEIISENDFIRQLLDNKSSASADQLDVLLFPKSDHAKSNVLQVRGDAGTGKTLVMLARIIRELKQDDLIGSKKALFVCFNKSLCDYVKILLNEHFPDIAKKVTVINIDKMVNRIIVNLQNSQDNSQNLPVSNILSNTVKTEQNSIFENDYKICYGSNLLNDIILEMRIKYANENVNFLAENFDKIEKRNRDWINDELDWIEGRKVIEFKGNYAEYIDYGRVGRGHQPFNPNKRHKEIILDILRAYNEKLVQEKKFTFPQAVNELLIMSKNNSNIEFSFNTEHAKYDIIAIDEVQDITIASIHFLLKLRKPGAKVIMAGDDAQKIYKIDFSWKQLGEDIIGHTVMLEKNFRNHPDIEKFASRLKGEINDYSLDYSEAVSIKKASINEIIAVVREFLTKQQTTCIIVDTQPQTKNWSNILKNADIEIINTSQSGKIFNPRVYITNIHQTKGLEFDNVIIPSTDMIFDDEEICKKLYYVAFTRAKKSLRIFYQTQPSEIFEKVYGDLL